MKLALIPSILLCLLAISACENEQDNFEAVDASEFLIAPEIPATFTVDSVVYDAALGGFERISSSSTWEVNALGGEHESHPLLVRVSGDSTSSSSSFIWEWSTDETALSHQLQGITYVGLTSPIAVGTKWDPLLRTSADLKVTVAGELIEIHKGGWQGRIDSVGNYNWRGDQNVVAAWVTLVDSENLIELREWKEVYGEGVGLLERHVRILDTQNTDSSLSWEDRAQAGFTVNMYRQ